MIEPWTKGPWTANLHHTQTQAGRTYGFVHAGAAVPIAAVTLGVEGMPEDEGRANARLIAAVLDLYEALIVARDFIVTERDNSLRDGCLIKAWAPDRSTLDEWCKPYIDDADDRIAMIDAAFRKARGQTP